MEEITLLKNRKISDFNTQVKNLRETMKIIGKNTVVLNTSEPIGVGHAYGLDKKYTVQVTAERVTFIDNSNKTQEITDAYLKQCKWFQVYIYTVEMSLEMSKFANHVQDSLTLSEMINK